MDFVSSFLTKSFSASTRVSVALLTSSTCASFESNIPSAVFSAFSFTLAESSVYCDLSSSLCLLSSSFNWSLAFSTSGSETVFSTKAFSACVKLSSASWISLGFACVLVKTWFTFFSALLKPSTLSEVYLVVSSWLSFSAFSFKAFLAAIISSALVSFVSAGCVGFSGDTCFSLRAFFALTIESNASWRAATLASLSDKVFLAWSRTLVISATESSVYLLWSNSSLSLIVFSSFSLSACKSLLTSFSAGFSTKFLIAASKLSIAYVNSWRVAFLFLNTLLASWRAWAKFLADSCVYLPDLPKDLAWSSFFLSSFRAWVILSSVVGWSFSIVLTAYSTTSDSLPYLSVVLNKIFPFSVTVSPSSGKTAYLFPPSVLYKTLPSSPFPVIVTDFLSDAVVAVICGAANFWAFL